METPSAIEKLNFKEYSLNQNFVQDVKRIITHHEFAREIRKGILNIDDIENQIETLLQINIF